MARWKPKDPGIFSPAWHAAMIAGVGERVLQTGLRGKAEARVYADRFRAFRMCLRHFSSYRAAAVERDFDCKLRTVEDDHGFCTVTLVIKRKVSYDACF